METQGWNQKTLWRICITWVMEASNDSYAGFHRLGAPEGEDIFLSCGSPQKSKPRLYEVTFSVMGLIMGIMFIPEFMEMRHRRGTLTELVCGMWFSTNWLEWLVPHVLVSWWALSHSWAPGPPIGKNSIFFTMLLPEAVPSPLTTQAVEVLMDEHDARERECSGSGDGYVWGRQWQLMLCLHFPLREPIFFFLDDWKTLTSPFSFSSWAVYLLFSTSRAKRRKWNSDPSHLVFQQFWQRSFSMG